MTKGKKQEEEETEGLTVKEIKQVIESARRQKRFKESFYNKPQNAETSKRKYVDLTKSPTSEEFTNYTVKVCGGSCHIQIPRRWLGKIVTVKVEEVKE